MAQQHAMPGVHDKMFRKVFGEPSNAAVYLRQFLPPAVAAALKLEEADPQPCTLIDEALAERFSDLLYRVPLVEAAQDADNADCYVYLLWEHQKSQDIFMAFRFLEYMVRIWDEWRAKHKDAKRLPMLFPKLLSQVDGEWKATTYFQDLVGPQGALREHLLPYIPSFRYLLTELSSTQEDDLPDEAFVRLVLLAMKYIRSPELLKKLAGWLDRVWELMGAGEQGRAGLLLFYCYILEGNEHVNVEGLQTVLKKLGPEAQKMATTAGERLREEGRDEGLREGEEKGREEGRREEKLATARRMLAKGVPVPEVAEFIDMPEEEVRKLAE